ncbi:MAG: SDR family oxidoreductase [Blastocatellia bacterium]|nr:SDR family oxidoreductase [Blastocatellia bacterium]
MKVHGESGKIALVTGATGLLGGEIAATLVKLGWSVRAIVRACDSREAARRLRARLNESGPGRLTDTSQMAALAGVVTAEGFGLPPNSQNDVDAIIHCAGETSFKDAGRCWNTNVGAAQRLIEFVRKMPRRPKVFFVSTASVCLSPKHSEVAEDAGYNGYENGYTRSKRHAERLIAESGLDAVIVRPSIVLSRGVRSRRMARSILWVIPVMRSLGEVPIDPDALIDMVPVDYAAEVIGRLVSKDSFQYRNYHISAGRAASPTCSEIIETVLQEDRSYGRIRFAGAASSNGGSRIVENWRSGRALMTALNYYAPFMNADIVYSNRRASEELGAEMPQCHKVTRYINELMRNFSPQEAFAESLNP